MTALKYKSPLLYRKFVISFKKVEFQCVFVSSQAEGTLVASFSSLATPLVS